MKKNIARLLCVLAMIALIPMMFTGCEVGNIPPSVESVEQFYQEHADDIQLIINFMLSTDYEKIHITDNDGVMLADLEEIPIEDSNVLEAVNRIINPKAYKLISKSGNTIHLLQWTGIRDIGCGIAYSINKKDAPDVGYSTEMIPLSEEGWFYYVSDFNLWREQNR